VKRPGKANEDMKRSVTSFFRMRRRKRERRRRNKGGS
jgi:hypothetical protein